MTKQELLDYSHKHPILVFDGVCNMCNSFVQFVLKNDKDGQVRFATLQSEEGQSISDPEMDTVYLIKDGKIYHHADVVLELTPFLKRKFVWISMLRIIPRPLRNWVYRLIARYRYKWFGKRDACMLPTPEERSRFI